MYRKSGNFCVIKFSCKNIFVVGTTHKNFLTVHWFWKSDSTVPEGMEDGTVERAYCVSGYHVYRDLESSCRLNSCVRKRNKKRRKPVSKDGWSKEGRNDHRVLTQEGVRTVPRLQVLQKSHLTALQTTSSTSFYAHVKMCWPLLFFVHVIIHCKIYFVFSFSWFAQTTKIFLQQKFPDLR